MLLTIDIGNSSIKAAIFDKDKLVNQFRENNLSKFILAIKNYPFKNVAICSVVPDLTKNLTVVIKQEFNITPFILSKKIKFNLTVEYMTSETLGIDRLCSAEGAFSLFKYSGEYINYNKDTYILTIDLGTATTINVIEHSGKFIGGLIAPGIKMMFETLNKNTAQLPDANATLFNSIIGNDTNSSIASGIVTSVTGMIEKTINYLKKDKSAKNVFVYVTGGNAKKIIPHFDFEFIYEEALVMYGINDLWKLNNK